ncbi:hypothetical protein BSKO_00742 [Bryopsis sp. KO-2023]|nr:hypothetical protein BSKO_00742 [Bryopsis sp. KO-2023]
MAEESGCPVLLEAEKNLWKTGKYREQLWSTSLSGFVRDQETLQANALDFGVLVFKSLPHFSYIGSKKVVDKVLVLALEDDAFLKTFAGLLVKYGGTYHTSGDCARIARWIYLVLDKLDVSGAAKAVSKLLEILGRNLDISLKTNVWKVVSKGFNRVVRGKNLLEQVLSVVKATGSPGLARALVDYGLSDVEAFAQIRPVVVGVYCDKILGSKTRPSNKTLWAYSSLLGALTHEEFEGTVKPAASRCVRRSTESVLPILSVLFADVNLDMSRHSKDLLTLLLPFVRHTKETYRESAVGALHNLARQLSDVDVLSELVDSVHALLGGKAEGKIKNVYERANLANALGALSVGGGKGAAAKALAEKTVDFCCSFYGSEVNEEVKLSVLDACGKWMAKCGTIPDSGLKMISKGLTEKDSLRRGQLQALLAALENADLRAQAGSIAAALVKVIKSGMAKVTQRVDGVQSFLAAAWIAAADHSADEVLLNEKVWETALAEGSPLFSDVSAAKLSPEEASQLAKLTQSMLSSHLDKLEKFEGSAEMVCKTLALLMLHHSNSTRQTAFSAVSRCLGASPALATTLLDALRFWLQQGKGAPVLEAAGDVDGPMSAALLSSRFSDAVMHAIPFVLDGYVDIAAKVLLRAHHPSVMAHRSRTWGLIKQRHKDVCEVLSGYGGKVSSVLCGEEGLASSDPDEVQGAMSAISSIMHDMPGVIFTPLLSALDTALLKPNWEQHNTLSEKDLAILNTPEGMLSTEVHNMVMELPDLGEKKKKNEKKPKGRFRSDKVPFGGQDDSSDDEPAKPVARPSVRPSQAQANGSAGKGRGGRGGGKSGAKDGSERQAEMLQRQLEEESNTRIWVKEIQRKLSVGLHAIGAMVKGNKRFCSESLDELDTMMPLLTSPLVGEGAAFDYAVALASCLPDKLGASCLSVACALRLIMISDEGKAQMTSKDLLEHPTLKTTLEAMVAVTKRKIPLPAPAYFLCFPVLRAILSVSTLSPLHDDALKLLSLHVTPGERLPREDSFKLLYHILANIPTYRNDVLPSLVSLCAGVIDTEILSALQGVVAANPLVRGAALHALPSVPAFATGFCPEEDEIIAILMIALHDPNEENQDAAGTLWDMSGASVPESFVTAIFPYLSLPHADIRQAATDALVEGLETFPDSSGMVLDRCVTVYAMGGGINERLGAAQALEACAEFFDSDGVHTALDFLLTDGLADEDAGVREKMVSAGVSLVDEHGASQVQALYKLLQSHLESPPAATSQQETRNDRVREGAVLLLATMAKHLLPEDPKVRDIIDRLIDTLGTPSEAVQKAAAGCLSPLVKKLQEDHDYIVSVIEKLKIRLTEGASYGDRRGAAYGIAGVIKGLGLSALKNFGVMDALKKFVEDKSDAKIREGAILAFECLCDRLGKLFEPYVISILPLVLTCFGDPALPVREATVDAARAIMRNLSAQGVKLVLPSLLKGLSDSVWRTKQGSIQLLGAMAWCAPKQLSSCLPTIVPKLSQVLSDPHQKVQKAAQLALNEVGATIRNPEVQELVPSLLSAIAQPNKFTRDCLDKLLDTVFVNTIDAPSLALIIPVVHRGLKDRSGEVKKRASRIVQNLCKLVNDPKDMAPYVTLLVPELQKAIVDPLPDVRAQASKGLGSLMGDMGRDALQDVMPWLIETLKSKGSSVERSGAAQALAEVLAVYGTAYFESILPQILEDCRAPTAAIREGGITLFRFLPYTMCDTFQTHLDAVLPLILDGLADENEGVREAAMAAGKTLVDVYADSSMVLILPAVEEGLSNDNWRIRQSSVELLGNLFYKVAGTSGKIQVDGDSDDEGVAVESYSAAIVHSLGMERRNDVLAKLYMARADVQYSVRSAALHIWKTVVVNTPKTLGEILPALMDYMIETLAHSGEDGRLSAGRCLGELVRKMGERVLPSILPILKDGTESESPATRQGVCYGLSEVLDNLSRSQLTDHLPMLLPAIQATLCDQDPEVREAAAGAFNALFKAGAGSVVDTVVPALLAQLQSDSGNSQALEGLQVILSVRPQTLNSMVPRLLHKPISVTNLQALGALASAAGASLQAHLPTILPAVLSLASMESGKPVEEAAKVAARQVALSVPEEATSILIAELLKGLEDLTRCLCSAELVKTLCSDAKVDVSEHTAELITALVPLLAEDNENVVKTCWTALGSVTATIPKDTQPSFVRCLKDAVASARDKERRKMTGEEILVQGFCLPKGLAPVLQIYLQGVLQGSSADLRELAAEGLGELVELTSTKMLRPFVIQITGPLIRIIGDRFPWQIKLAILTTLGLLINKAGDGLKAFVPQLQTTFLKCLQDPTPNVRDQAAKNLGQLTRMSPRVDQLAADLSGNAARSEPAVRRSYLAALRGMFQTSGDRINPAVLSKTGHEIIALLSSMGEEESDIVAVASCLGAFCLHCGPDDMKNLMSGPLGPPQSKWPLRLAHAVIMATVAKLCSSRLKDLDMLKGFIDGIVQFSRDDKVPVKIAACRAGARLVIAENEEGGESESLSGLIPAVATCLAPDQSTDLHSEGLAALRKICTANPMLLQVHFGDIVPSLCSLVQSATGIIKLSSEKTLAQVLNMGDEEDAVRSYLGSNPGAMVKSVLTESYLRKLQRLPLEKEEEDEDY